MELSIFNVGDRQFQITGGHWPDTIYIVEAGVTLIEIEPRWVEDLDWSDPSPDSYDIYLTPDFSHPFFEGEFLFLEKVIEEKAAILKAIATIQSLVAAGLL